jgi:fucose permease
MSELYSVKVVFVVALFYVVSFHVAVFGNLTPTLGKDSLLSDTYSSAAAINLMDFRGIIIVPKPIIKVINHNL